VLLSTQSSTPAKSPRQTNEGTEAETFAQQRSGVATQPPTFHQAIPVPTALAGAHHYDNQHYEPRQLGDLPGWLQAIATILLVIFAAWQMRFVRRGTTATENAANAARDNAKAAKDAAIATERYAEMTEQMVEAAKQ
jgi:hypothetical protein